MDTPIDSNIAIDNVALKAKADGFLKACAASDIVQLHGGLVLDLRNALERTDVCITRLNDELRYARSQRDAADVSMPEAVQERTSLLEANVRLLSERDKYRFDWNFADTELDHRTFQLSETMVERDAALAKVDAVLSLCDKWETEADGCGRFGNDLNRGLAQSLRRAARELRAFRAAPRTAPPALRECPTCHDMIPVEDGRCP